MTFFYLDTFVFILAKSWWKISSDSDDFSLKYKKANFSLKGVCLQGIEIQKAGYHFVIDKAFLTTKMNFHSGELEIDLFLEKLVMQQKISRNKLVSSSLFKHLPLKVHLHTQQAEVNIENSEAEICHNAQFDLEAILDRKTTEIEFSFYQNKRKILHAKCSKFCLTMHFFDCPIEELYATLPFAQYYLPPFLSELRVERGVVDGELHCRFDDGGICFFSGVLQCDDFKIFDTKTLLAISFDHFQGDLFFDFSTACQDWKGFLKLDNGNLCLENCEVVIWQNLLNISQLSAEILVDHGQIVHSTVHGQFMKMDGKIDLQFTNETIMQAFFQGKAEQLSSLFPLHLQERFLEAFQGDELICNATVKKTKDGVYLEGILENHHEKEDRIRFGCDLKEAASSHEEDLTKQLPFELSCFLSGMKSQLCLDHKRVGWIKAEALSLKKYFSFFLLNQTPFHLLGEVDFEASFDEKSLIFFYKTDQLQLKSSSVSFKIQEPKKDVSDFTAIHIIDLKTFQHRGVLPFQKAEYKQKDKLHFTEGSGLFLFENQHIFGSNLHATSLGLEFEADLEICVESFDSIDLKITTQKVEGKVQHLRSFLDRIKPSFLWKLPFQGEMQSSKEGFILHLHFSPAMEIQKIEARGSVLSHLITPCLSLSEMRFDFHFDGMHRSCDLTNFRALFHSGYLDTFPLCAEMISFSDLPHLSVQAVFACQKEKETTFLQLSSAKKNHLTLHSPEIELQVERIKDLFKISGKKELFSFQAEIEREVNQLKIDHAKVSHERWGELSCSAFYDLESKKFYSKLHSFTLFVQDFFASQALPEACFTGKAEIYYQPNQKQFECNFDELFFKLDEPLPLTVDRLIYTPKTSRLEVEGCQIDWKRNSLSLLLSHFSFPPLLNEVIEKNERFRAKIDFVSEEGKNALKLFLEDQEIDFFQHSLLMRAPIISMTPSQWKLQSEAQFLGENFFTTLRINPQISTKAELLLHQTKEPFQKENDTITCLLAKGKNWSLQEMNGSCHDYSFALSACQREESIELQGKMNFPLSSPLLQNFFPTFPFSQIYGTFSLTGCLVLGSTFEKSNFLGAFSVNNCSFYQTEFSTLNSDVQLENGQFFLKNFSIEDQSGKLHMQQGSFSTIDQTFCLKNLQIEKLFLSHLRAPWAKQAQRKKFFRSFRLSHFFLDHLYGSLQDRSSLVGWGNFSFSHVTRRTLMNQLLYLPSEITARLGLDFSNFVPVKGDVDFEIKEEKIFLNEFKNMHSEAKRSSFFLADTLPSTIDFNGNLNIFVKMKHHNLLMKLAEFFTLSIKGTVRRPSYTLINSSLQKKTSILFPRPKPLVTYER